MHSDNLKIFVDGIEDKQHPALFRVDYRGNLLSYHGRESHIVIPENVKCIDSYAFLNHKKSIDSVVFPKDIKSISQGAFNDQNLKTLDFSHCEKLGFILDNAFSCNQIESIKFPEKTTLKYDYLKIKNAAFGRNELKTIDIPSFVHIQGNVFSNNKMKEIKVDGNSVDVVGSRGGVDIDKLGVCLKYT